MPNRLTDPTPPDFISAMLGRPEHAAFNGDQRAKVLGIVGAAIVEGRASTVMQFLKRDPSIALDQVSFKENIGGLQRDVHLDLAQACLKYNLPMGYVFAIARGYDANKLLPIALQPGRTGFSGDLIQTHLSTLLALGADPAALEPAPDGQSFISQAFGLAFDNPKAESYPGIANLLLDAGCSPVYDARLACPVSKLIGVNGWSDTAQSVELATLLVRLVKAGALLDRPSGSPAVTPLSLALGKKNGLAVIALVRLGCCVDPETMPGKQDIYTAMDANGLQEFKPLVQEALMAQQIQKTVKDSAKTESVPSSQTESVRTRRRLDSI